MTFTWSQTSFPSASIWVNVSWDWPLKQTQECKNFDLELRPSSSDVLCTFINLWFCLCPFTLAVTFSGFMYVSEHVCVQQMKPQDKSESFHSLFIVVCLREITQVTYGWGYAVWEPTCPNPPINSIPRLGSKQQRGDVWMPYAVCVCVCVPQCVIY